MRAKVMILLRDLLRSLYPDLGIKLVVMGNHDKELNTTVRLLESNTSKDDYMQMYVRTIEIYRDNLNRLTGILKIILSNN